MPHQYMRHPLVYIATCRSMQEVYLQMLNTTTYAPHGARRWRALSLIAGGAVLGEILEELEPVRGLAGWPRLSSSKLD